MKVSFQNITQFCLLAGFAAVCQVRAADNNMNNPGYAEFNLVSDLANKAIHTDARLVNPWGIVAGPDSVWVNDNGASLTTAYGPSGHGSAVSIAIPAPGGGGGAPSGLVFNDTQRFVVSNGTKSAPSTFLMATEDGTIVAWNHSINGTNAVIMATVSNAVYKGLAIARDTNGAPQIYAANFHAGIIDVFDSQFNYAFSFTDPELPSGYAPFNVRVIDGRLFVSFAVQKQPDAHDDQAGPGNGLVEVFDTDGTLLRYFTAHGPLNSPWGMAVAPKRFGKFSKALLVGNFGDGTINAFDLVSGKYLGALADLNGNTIVIDGLWGLTFEREPIFEHECEFAAERLYFTAGLNGEADGLLGFIRPAAPNFEHAH